MGWSCSVKAGDVLDAWKKKCVANSGSSNVWSEKGKEFFFDTSSREHDDGSITGKIMKRVSEKKPDGSYFAKQVGSFKINGDGTIERAPKFLKDVVVVSRYPEYAGIGTGG